MRLRALLVLLALGATACSSIDDGDGTASRSDTAGTPTVTVAQAVESSAEEVPSALDSIDSDGLPAPLIEPGDLLDGGPPPDGIPPIDEPRFHRTQDVDFLTDDEPVLAVVVDGEARAYPVQIIIWHEIVNDTFGTLPVTITYCPLCNTAIGFERRLDDGRVLSFGTSASCTAPRW